MLHLLRTHHAALLLLVYMTCVVMIRSLEVAGIHINCISRWISRIAVDESYLSVNTSTHIPWTMVVHVVRVSACGVSCLPAGGIRRPYVRIYSLWSSFFEFVDGAQCGARCFAVLS
jgi:hypothetical protein